MEALTKKITVNTIDGKVHAITINNTLNGLQLK